MKAAYEVPNHRSLQSSARTRLERPSSSWAVFLVVLWNCSEWWLACRSTKHALSIPVNGFPVFRSEILYLCIVDDGTGAIHPPGPHTSKQEKSTEPQPFLKPQARVGWHVVVIGRVLWHEMRRAPVDSIAQPNL
ncbi:hypothetical protein B0H19DRAFT_1229666 [Mycena capillaripes]|nr:hypothetical protein B0H19DRAFT_1229666 [Mycena capillaripes]